MWHFSVSIFLIYKISKSILKDIVSFLECIFKQGLLIRLAICDLFGKIKDPNIVNAPINEFTDKHIWKKERTGACAIRKNGILIDENEYIRDIYVDGKLF